MGLLEEKSKQNLRRKNIQKIILGTIALVGVMGVALVAPNVLGAMVKMGLVPKKRQKELIKRSFERLKKRGLVKFENGLVLLTESGQRVIDFYEQKNLLEKKKEKWDKRWRVLIFDITEKRKILREKVRRTLSGIGFERLQDSVWIYPYDCEDLITLLKIDFKVGKDLIYMIVDEIENDKIIKDKFSLS